MKFALCLIVLALAGSTALAQAPGQESNWKLTTKVDLVSDRTDASAALMSVDGKSRLSFVCNGIKEPVLSVQYHADTFLGSSQGTVIFRVNTGEPSFYLFELQDRVAWTPDEKWIGRLAQQLTDGNDRIIVRALDYNAQPHDGVFQSVNAAKALRDIAKICADQSIVARKR
jgi:hypothetical protein